MGATAWLCGCVAAGSQPPSAASAAAATDPLLQLVGNAPIGQPVSLDTAGASTKVQVLASYHAASGRNCRRYVVLGDPARTEPRLTCSSASGWVEVRPLIATERLATTVPAAPASPASPASP